MIRANDTDLEIVENGKARCLYRFPYRIAQLQVVPDRGILVRVGTLETYEDARNIYLIGFDGTLRWRIEPVLAASHTGSGRLDTYIHFQIEGPTLVVVPQTYGDYAVDWETGKITFLRPSK